MENNFNPGDVVMVISGGPKMTVEEVRQESGSKVTVWCVWTDNGKKMTDSFPAVTLKRVQ